MTEAPSTRNPFTRDNPLAASYLCVFLYSGGEAALHLLVPPYLSDGLGFGPALIGLLSAVVAVSSLVMRLPVGAWYRSDRVRLLLATGGLLSAAGFAVVPLVTNGVQFGIIMAMDGVGWALATTTQLAVLVASRPADMTVASAMGWYAGFTGLGHGLGGLAAGLIADRLGYGPSFLLLALLPALATAVMLRALPAQLDAAAEAAPDGPEDSPRPDKPAGGVRSTLGAVRTMPVAVYSGVLVMFFINYQSGLLNTFHPVMALAAGLTLTQVGTLTSMRSFASSVTRLSSGPLFARSNGAALTTPMLVVGAAALWLLPLVRASFWWQVPLFLAVGLARGLLRVTGAAQAFEGGGDTERSQGMVAALLHIGLDAGKVAGPPIGGIIAQVFGVPGMFQISAVAMLLAYGIFRYLAVRNARAPQPAGR